MGAEAGPQQHERRAASFCTGNSPWDGKNGYERAGEYLDGFPILVYRPINFEWIFLLTHITKNAGGNTRHRRVRGTWKGPEGLI